MCCTNMGHGSTETIFNPNLGQSPNFNDGGVGSQEIEKVSVSPNEEGQIHIVDLECCLEVEWEKVVQCIISGKEVPWTRRNGFVLM